MRFGKSAAEAAEEPSRGGAGGGDWIRYLKEGDTTFRILEDPDDWTYYWEHFSPSGFSFPCNSEDDCPGCSSENEKMSKVNRRIAFNALQSWQGNDYVNVYKIGPMVGDKLENRYKRLDTLTDRDYTITKYKTNGDRWDFDVEGGIPTPVDFSKYDLKDIESMLMEQWEEHWGGGATGHPAETKPARRATIAPAQQQEDPPFEEEKVYQEADLRQMDLQGLRDLLQSDMKLTPPVTLDTPDEVVDWLMELQQS